MYIHHIGLAKSTVSISQNLITIYILNLKFGTLSKNGIKGSKFKLIDLNPLKAIGSNFDLQIQKLYVDGASKTIHQTMQMVYKPQFFQSSLAGRL